MNYSKIYNDIMARAAGRQLIKGEHEKHHIIPKSLGGSDDPCNIAVLTFKEHFLAHWLLVKFTQGQDRKKMAYALSTMTRKGKNHEGRVISGWQYSLARKNRIEAMTGNKNSFGYIQSKETREKKSKQMIGNRNALGHRHTPQCIKEIKNRLKGNKYAKGKHVGAANPKSKPVICLNDKKQFESSLQAAKFYGTGPSSVNRVCRGERPHVLGRVFVYV